MMIQMNEYTTQRTVAILGARLGDGAQWVTRRLSPVGDASAAMETVSFLDSFTPSLMPRTSEHQGLAAGLHILGARLIGGRIDALQTMAIGASASTPTSLAARAVTFAVGQAAMKIPEQENETLWWNGARAGGEIVRAAAISGALYDGARALQGRTKPSSARLLITATMVTGGGLYWAGRRLNTVRR
jgi:hypothetical protein